MSDYKAILKALDQMKKKAEHLEQQRIELAKEVALLKKAGVTKGRPHWKGGKYLYLVHPQKDGERPREYIGNDPAKVAEALARVERLRELECKTRLLAEAEGDLRDTLRLLTRGY